ncbi:MAG: ATP phosphoribosyltransferase regulatory subunit [Gammaproteobacteria bacterium]
MQKKNLWLLPDGIEEVLPDDAKHLENLRRAILDVFAKWGYTLVIPPFVDFLNSLLTGSGHDLALQTFKLTDQLSGEMLGIRADMTPQVARIDAHNTKRSGPNRLCYAGTILHTVGDPLERTRSPMQIGAELYGHKGLESDLEVISLMLEMLSMSGLQDIHLDLGHVGIYRALSEQAELSESEEAELFDILQRKARPELRDMLDGLNIDDKLKSMLAKLPELNGGRETLDQANEILSDADTKAKLALAELAAVAEKLTVLFPQLPLSFDLAELRGYHYHTGIVFAAFVPTVGREIARGGRYDNIGAVFGRARPATGFSSDLKVLSLLTKHLQQNQPSELIFAPAVDDPSLIETVRDLRARGYAVLQELPGQSGGHETLGCTALLEKKDNIWIVKAIV